MPVGIKELGELIGIKKLELEHSTVNKDLILKNADFKKKAIAYCIRDNEIVINFINILIKNIDVRLLNQTLSVSALALKTFLTHYNQQAVNTDVPPCEEEWVRPAYFGGRCEVFGNAKPGEFIYHFDFAAMYANIMREPFCFGKIKKVKNIKNTAAPGFYNVQLRSEITDIPVLPFRNEDGKLLFPNGTWVGTYWFEEINYFCQLGGVIEKINFKLEYAHYSNGLENFIVKHLKLRSNSMLEKKFWKLFINSLAGRLGMQFTCNKTIVIDKAQYAEIDDSINIVKELHVNNTILLTYASKDNKKEINSNVSIAAAITSRGRIKIHKGYMSVIKSGGRPLYSDTDSIFAAFTKNVDNETHGEIFWDTAKQDTKWDHAVFALSKGYAIKNKYTEIVKLRGFKKNAVTFEMFKNAFINNKILAINEEQIQKKNYILSLKLLEKNTILSNYDKRTFNKNKDSTKPIIIKIINGNAA